MAVSLLSMATGQALPDETVSTENAYRAIIDRNPFNLKPPPPPPAAAAPEPAKTGELKLTGITSFGRRKAFFMLSDPKGGPQAQPEYYSLAVDEKRDNLEVIAIDEVAKTVRVRYDGGEMLMTFATHGVAAPAATTAPAPGATKPPGFPAGATPATTGTANTANYTTAYNMAATPGTAPAQNTLPLGRIPSRPTRTTGATATQIDPGLAARYGLQPMPSNVQPPPAQPNGDTAEQVLLLELQRQSNPQMSLPPTPGLPGQTQPGAPTLPAPQLPGIPPGMR